MNKYTVLGYYTETGQSFSHHVFAKNAQHAFYVVAEEHESASMVCAIKGHIHEGEEVEFAGESVVDADIILSQPEIFNRDEVEPSTSNIIADFEIKDWHLTELGDEWDGPVEHRDNYRFVIEQSPTTSQVYFKVYPKSLDALSNEVTLNGLSGVIEIRNGKPAISLGVNEDQLPIHVESDIYQGLHIHWDAITIEKKTLLYSFDHGMKFESSYFACDDGAWLMEARTEIADNVFADYDFEPLMVTDTDEWDIIDTDWSRTVYFDNEHGGDCIKGKFDVIFGENSTVVASISERH